MGGKAGEGEEGGSGPLWAVFLFSFFPFHFLSFSLSQGARVWEIGVPLYYIGLATVGDRIWSCFFQKARRRCFGSGIQIKDNIHAQAMSTHRRHRGGLLNQKHKNLYRNRLTCQTYAITYQLHLPAAALANQGVEYATYPSSRYRAGWREQEIIG